jgi:hypothetical protein
MPESHRKHQQWTPGRLLNWALAIGPGTRDVVRWQLDNRPHPEQGYRACPGLLNLARRYGSSRLEAACLRALAMGSPTRKRIQSSVPFVTGSHQEKHAALLSVDPPDRHSSSSANGARTFAVSSSDKPRAAQIRWACWPVPLRSPAAFGCLSMTFWYCAAAASRFRCSR